MSGIDSHCHVFVDAQVPTTPAVGGAAYAPPPVDVHDHATALDEAGCDAGVLVQPSAYGQDHRCLLAALARRPGRLRGVACVGPDTPLAELREMHRLGVRATRLQDGYPGGVPVSELVRVGEVVAPLGWHVEVWTDLRTHLGDLGAGVRRCPVPVVVDHLGYLPSDVGLDHPATRLLLELVAEGHAWVTISGLERLLPHDVSPDGPGSGAAWAAHESAVAARVAALVEARPDHLLWGSDWPHVGVDVPLPDQAEVRGRLDRWVPDPAVRHAILHDNPVRRYGFDEPLPSSDREDG